MPKIKIAKTQKIIEVAAGANLMQALLAAGLPVASSCHGDAVCGKCVVQITNGLQNLDQPEPLEFQVLKKYSFQSHQRLSCQIKVFFDIEIDTSYW